MNLKKKDSRIQVYHQENNGCGAARIVALPKTKGKYIYFMDADDLLELNALQEFYDIAEEKNIDLIICKAINYNSDTGQYYETENYNMTKLYRFVGDEKYKRVKKTNKRLLNSKSWKLTKPLRSISNLK